MKNTYFIFVLVLFVSSCIIEPDECLSPSYASFCIVDRNNTSVNLIENGTYNPDSIRLTVGGQEVIEDYISGIGIDFLFNVNLDLSMFNDSLYFLYLNWQDTDTLTINAVYTDEPCVEGKYSSINQIIHNGNDTTTDFSKYLIKK